MYFGVIERVAGSGMDVQTEIAYVRHNYDGENNEFIYRPKYLPQSFQKSGPASIKSCWFLNTKSPRLATCGVEEPLTQQVIAFELRTDL